MEIYQFLIDFFDLNCTNKGNLFLFYEEKLFVLASETTSTMIGCYSEQKDLNKRRFRTEETEKEDGNRYNRLNFEERDNRSLNIGGVTESIIVDPDADTPSFNYDESHTSFRSSLVSDSESIENHGELFSSLKTTNGGDSPMKVNDLKRSLKQSLNLFGSCATPEQKNHFDLQMRDSLDRNGGF